MVKIKLSNKALFFLTGIIILVAVAGVVSSSVEDLYNLVGHEAVSVGPGTFGGDKTETHTFPGIMGLGKYDSLDIPPCANGEEGSANVGNVIFYTPLPSSGEPGDEPIVCTSDGWKGLITGDKFATPIVCSGDKEFKACNNVPILDENGVLESWEVNSIWWYDNCDVAIEQVEDCLATDTWCMNYPGEENPDGDFCTDTACYDVTPMCSDFSGLDFSGFSVTGVGPTINYGPGGCFIATAAYGSYMSPEVEVLKDFRDDVLLKTSIGEEFVEIYYDVSPPVADFIAEHESLRVITRVALTPLVYLVKFKLIALLMVLFGSAILAKKYLYK